MLDSDVHLKLRRGQGHFFLPFCCYWKVNVLKLNFRLIFRHLIIHCMNAHNELFKLSEFWNHRALLLRALAVYKMVKIRSESGFCRVFPLFRWRLYFGKGHIKKYAILHDTFVIEGMLIANLCLTANLKKTRYQEVTKLFASKRCKIRVFDDLAIINCLDTHWCY